MSRLNPNFVIDRRPRAMNFEAMTGKNARHTAAQIVKDNRGLKLVFLSPALLAVRLDADRHNHLPNNETVWASFIEDTY